VLGNSQLFIGCPTTRVLMMILSLVASHKDRKYLPPRFNMETSMYGFKVSVRFPLTDKGDGKRRDSVERRILAASTLLPLYF
jgi:hypothetical protein